LKDGKRFLWTSERDGFRHLYLYSLDGAAPQQLTKGAWQVTDFAGVDEKAGRAYFRSTEASPLERQLYSVRLDGGDKRRITVGAGTHRIVMAPGASCFLDVYSNLTSPPEGTLRNANGDAIAPIVRRIEGRWMSSTSVPTEMSSLRARMAPLLWAPDQAAGL
jgi:dipeptidyl-peptidase-4